MELKKITIDGQEIEIYVKEIVSANILEVAVGSTGFRGGDTGHGGRTYIRFTNKCSTDMRCKISNQAGKYEDKWEMETEKENIELVFGGDTEFETLIQGLEHILKVLKFKVYISEDKKSK